MIYKKSHTALLIISNTITIIPYLYFLSLSKEQSLSAALAFALFYTFRMTGVFFLQTLTALFAPSLLAASVLIGGAGALVGILSTWWSVALLPAAGLLGISASWLPPADLMVRQKAKLTEQPLKNDWKEALFFLFVLLFALRLPDDLQGVGLFGSYFALFVLAAKSSQTFNNLPKRPLMQRNQLFNKQFLLYFFFFLLLFGLRSARLIKSNALFEWAITGFLFLFALLLITLTKRSRSWKQPLHLNVLTFIRGVIGNFLFLFGSVYVTGRLGAQALSTHVYLPYALGLFGAMFLGGKLAHRLEKQLVPTYLLGLMAGVLLFSSDTLIPISLFVISFFNAGLNQWLTKQYLTAKPEAIEQQSLAKYATQSKGSLVHQFLLMTLLFVILRFEHQPLAFLFQLSGTTATSHTSRIQSFLEPAKWGSIAGVLCLLVGGLVVFYRQLKKTKV